MSLTEFTVPSTSVQPTKLITVVDGGRSPHMACASKVEPAVQVSRTLGEMTSTAGRPVEVHTRQVRN